jgi:hypothetical protein
MMMERKFRQHLHVDSSWFRFVHATQARLRQFHLTAEFRQRSLAKLDYGERLPLLRANRALWIPNKSYRVSVVSLSHPSQQSNH